MLVGRECELRRLADVTAGVRQGRSHALVLRGPAGVGKSALLQHIANHAAPGVRVLSTVGVESEAELPFAALHQLLRPLLGSVDVLPAPQSAALRSAFGMDTTPADRFLVALAALTLLSEASRTEPLLLLVDDAHWLDSPSADALLFVARRLGAEGVAVIFAVRDGSQPFPAPGVPDLRVPPLEAGAARSLLAHLLPDAAPAVRERLLREADGIPLALVELSAALSPAQLRGAAALPDELPLTERLQRLFRCRVTGLLAEPGNALLLTAAEGDGDLAVIVRAAGDTERALDELSAAATAGLVSLDPERVRFRHPLVRSAVYQGAPLSERRAAHLALADALGEGDDRHVWHLAAAAVGPDDRVAQLLAEMAGRSRRTGGVATASKALRRAAALASAPRDRARLLIDAAECAWKAAGTAQAEALLAEAEGLLTEAEPLSEVSALRARLVQVRGAIAHASGDPAVACLILLEGARLVQEDDPRLACETLVMAARSAWVADDPARLAEIAGLLARLPAVAPEVRNRFVTHLRYLAGPAGAANPDTRHGGPAPEVLDGGPAETAGTDGRKVPDIWLSGTDPRPWVWPPTFLPYLLDATEPLRDAHRRAVETLRNNGAIGSLPMSLAPLVALELVTGPWPTATANGTEALSLALESGQLGAASHLRAMLAWLAAAQGDGDRCRVLARESLELSAPRRIASAITLAHWAQGLNALAEGEPLHAVKLLGEICARGGGAGHFMLRWIVLPDFVEACVRAGESERARQALTDCGPAHPALANHPQLRSGWRRGRALLATGDEAEELFLGALADTGLSPFETGRSHLLYGEWLRRHRRIKPAREQLHLAEAQLDGVGALPWSELARAELRAAGGRPAQESSVAAAPQGEEQRLTARELQVVRLAAQGLSNGEIAARLFLSPRTVGYHLYKIFPKVGVTSRAQLYGRSFG
ncbi:helix-turn-helix transcriptional regulator [Streptomyces sp. CA-181903]|uniref:helix-turn-helix transcriptional regulator n=1 Tax=Streptomyces sp. CA-181903 TaxID=3240055 RepID=UPI003D90A7A8